MARSMSDSPLMFPVGLGELSFLIHLHSPIGGRQPIHTKRLVTRSAPQYTLSRPIRQPPSRAISFSTATNSSRQPRSWGSQIVRWLTLARPRRTRCNLSRFG